MTDDASPDLTTRELTAVAELMAQAGADVREPLRSSLITGGRSNLTFRLSDGHTSWVLRTAPRVGRTPSAHDVAREFRVTRALQDSGVPVPRPVALCEDEGVIGAPFAVAEFVAGECLQSRSDLEGIEDGTIEACVHRLVETLAALHSVDHVAVGLERFGRPDGYAERQLRRWSGQWQLVGAPALSPLASRLADRLGSAVPVQRSVGIVHGDYRIDNTILQLDDNGVRVAAVVDWELSTIGDPVADAALMCAYRHPALDLVLGAPSAWTSERLPSIEDLARGYEAVGGVPLVDWNFHLGLAYLKIAVIAAGIDYRYRAGATHGEGFASAGQAVRPLLEEGLASL